MAFPLTYQEMMDQLQLGNGLASPPPVAGPGAVPGALTQPAPFDTSVVPGTAFGTPYPTPLPAPPPTETAPAPAPAPAAAPATGGYTPQPRPALPPGLAAPVEGAPPSTTPDVFGDYRNVYNPPAETDPMATLFGAAGQATPPNRALQPPWMTGQGGPQPGAGGPQTGQGVVTRAAQQAGPSPGERALLRRSPAYGRAIDRIRMLDRMRSNRGF